MIKNRDLQYYSKAFLKTFIILLVLWGVICLMAAYDDPGLPMVAYFFDAILIDPGIISHYEQFFFPLFWFLLHGIPCLGLLISFSRDHFGMGSYLFLKFKTRRRYFSSKLLSLAIVLLGSTFVFSALFLCLAAFKGGLDWTGAGLFLRFMTMIAIENMILVLAGVLLVLFFSTRLSILALVLNLVFAMTTNIPYIVGQASLPYKQEVFGGAFSLRQNIITLSLYAVILLLISYFYLGTYNFYGDEQ